ncbi:type I restriction-modification system subunit M [Achromobacter kerstersii]|uniref:site-specific DNA-methyltransferase (adenine-specific) n=1 Tax=Achromobacter kerstersii TaxID=1353890 RepID=A0A6S7ADQ5_9BURK|nr:class I SAM-dependent DNA methyltransferase [Achromobacter kerstersii]CAB3714263.1 putative type I restriction enzymeP M protein [Achromobacter kerstersii]
MITGTIKSQVDRIWDAFWSGGISNPLEVIEQMTYLLFIKRLDEIHSVREKKAARLRKPIEEPVFGPELQNLRWSVFKQLGDAATLYDVVANQVFPFIKTLGEADSTYATHMKDARFTIPSPALLAKVVDMLDAIPMDDRDTKGDLYEYMLGKIASAGQNGQFRTPRHIIKLMVEMMAPKPTDRICDPACGTAGFLVAAAEYLQHHHSNEIYTDQASAKRFNHDTFHGFDFDSTMLRVGSMNMLLHGVENPAIENRDSLSESHAGVEGQFSLILANPPFAGSLDYESTAQDLQRVVKTKKTELLFLALFLRLLKPGGRAAVIVPDGVLFGSSKAHKTLRKMLVEEQKLDAIVSMPSGVFRPYAGVSTAILLFTKTNSGGTDRVWFYDMSADGYSLDDKRNELGHAKHENDNLPDILSRWQNQAGEVGRERTEQSFLVPKDELTGNDYDLSINRYKQVVHEVVEYESPAKIIGELRALEAEISKGTEELEGMLA